MFARTPSKPRARAQSLIGAGTRIEGNITFCGALRIDGAVVGTIRSERGEDSTLVLGDRARVDGEIHAPRLVVNGAVNGPVFAAETLELQSGARIKGDVHYEAVEIRPGAIVEGTLVHRARGSGLVGPRATVHKPAT